MKENNNLFRKIISVFIIALIVAAQFTQVANVIAESIDAPTSIMAKEKEDNPSIHDDVNKTEPSIFDNDDKLSSESQEIKEQKNSELNPVRGPNSDDKNGPEMDTKVLSPRADYSDKVIIKDWIIGASLGGLSEDKAAGYNSTYDLHLELVLDVNPNTLAPGDTIKIPKPENADVGSWIMANSSGNDLLDGSGQVIARWTSTNSGILITLSENATGLAKVEFNFTTPRILTNTTNADIIQDVTINDLTKPIKFNSAKSVLKPSSKDNGKLATPGTYDNIRWDFAVNYEGVYQLEESIGKNFTVLKDYYIEDLIKSGRLEENLLGFAILSYPENVPSEGGKALGELSIPINSILKKIEQNEGESYSSFKERLKPFEYGYYLNSSGVQTFVLFLGDIGNNDFKYENFISAASYAEKAISLGYFDESDRALLEEHFIKVYGKQNIINGNIAKMRFSLNNKFDRVLLDTDVINTATYSHDGESKEYTAVGKLLGNSGGAIPSNKVKLTLTDQDRPEVPLAGAQFKLQEWNGTSWIDLGLYTTDEYGSILTPDLQELKKYRFVQVTPPNSHYLIDQSQGYNPTEGTVISREFTISISGDRNIHVKNKRLYKGILFKIDEDTGMPLQGAEFELKDKEGTSRGVFTSDKDGKIIIDKLDYGSYTLTEIKAPLGYELKSNAIDIFTSTALTENSFEEVITNKLITPKTGTVVLYKIDSIDNTKVLSGAIFTLQDSKGDDLQSDLVTGVDGKLSIEGLAPGDYQLVETQAPTGYKLDSTPIKFTITGEDTIELTKENSLIKGSVLLTKIDSQSGEVLSGAIFTLQDSKGDDLQSDLVTGVDGKLSIEGLAPGDYQLVETQAPTGYKLDSTPIKFTITGEDTIELTKENSLIKGSVLLTKIDEKTNKKLHGATFELRSANGKILLENLKTGINGTLSITDLVPGDYQLVETQAPTGYMLDSVPLKFTISNDFSDEIRLIKTNQKKEGVIRLEKRDTKSGELLSGAKFKLLDKDGKVVRDVIKTNELGAAEITDLPNGEYNLIETQSPRGYILDSSPILIKVSEDTEAVEYVKYNTKKTSNEIDDSSKSGEILISKNTYKYLPNTGENKAIILIIIGVIVLMIGFMILVNKRKY